MEGLPSSLFACLTSLFPSLSFLPAVLKSQPGTLQIGSLAWLVLGVGLEGVGRWEGVKGAPC